MQQISDQDDWVSQPTALAQKPFKDVRPTRPSCAEEKAVLLLELGSMLRVVPVSVRNGSVNYTRAWKTVRNEAAKVAAAARSSTQQIRTAINSLRRFQ